MALIARTVLLAKKETNYGTDATPAGTDGILAMNVRPDVRFQSLIRNVQKATLGRLAPISETGGGAPGGGISFDVEVRGVGGTAGTAATFVPKVDSLLQACGLTPSTATGTAGSCSYAPLSTGIPGVTIYTYLDGQVFKLVGCRGNVALALKAGQPGVLTFTMQALTIDLSDASLVVGTYEANAPAPPAWVKYGTVSAYKLGTGSYEAIVQNVSLDLGQNVQVAPNANTVNNRNEIVLADRDVKGSMDPELVALTAYDYWTKMKAATTIGLTAQVGTTQCNRLIVTANQIVLGQIGQADRSGKRAFSIPFKCAESAGDDELALNWT